MSWDRLVHGTDYRCDDGHVMVPYDPATTPTMSFGDDAICTRCGRLCTWICPSNSFDGAWGHRMRCDIHVRTLR
jgi:hypothetical protein